MKKMMKKLMCAAMLSTFLMAGTSYAACPVSWDSLVEGESQSVLLPTSELQSKGMTQQSAARRGEIFSAGIVEISNQQDGTLYITADTLAHRTVEKIYQTVFLDKWDDEAKDWVQIKYWEFERGIEEEPNLSSYHIGMIVSGCELNKYYRVRGMHLVQVGDTYEGKTTETHGVLLTDHEI